MRRFALVWAVATAAIVPLAGCSSSNSAPRSMPSEPMASSQMPAIGQHGFDVSGMDRTANACDNFYQFAVGQWRQAHPLPAQFSRFGRFEEVAERNREVLHSILDSAASANDSANPGTRKLGQFYASCLDEAAIERAGYDPIRGELDRIAQASDRAAITTELIRLHARGDFAPVYRFGATTDIKNSPMTIAEVSQSGLGLPDRDYYLQSTPRFENMRKAYVEHMTKMFGLIGESPAEAEADARRVLSLETELARISMSRLDQRDPEKTYRIVSLADADRLAPDLQLGVLFQTTGASFQSLNVAEPDYLAAASRLLASAPVEDWKAYLRWNVLTTSANSLSSAFVNEDFNFRGRMLSGQKEQRERWKRCVTQTDNSLGDLLGQEFVTRRFSPEAKRRALELIDNLTIALREDIPTLDWMSAPTKTAALAKLEAFRRRIGYPDKWIDYGPLTVSRASYHDNVVASREFRYRRSLARIGHPFDPDEWSFFTPATVNASYSPERNDITFPAGILQPPFYDPNADDAYNYGGIGVVIGHEMTHGFDDEGARFDAKGNLRDWWTAEDLKRFKERSECIARQYDAWEIEPGVHLTGHLVLGEAIADLGGATIAYRAYERSLKNKPRQTLDGFSPEQRFFLGFAQVWGENIAAQEAQRRVLTDVHAAAGARVNNTVSNMPEFANAFHCGSGSKMVRSAAERCAIW
jgi:putative endopeptidase